MNPSTSTMLDFIGTVELEMAAANRGQTIPPARLLGIMRDYAASFRTETALEPIGMHGERVEYDPRLHQTNDWVDEGNTVYVHLRGWLRADGTVVRKAHVSSKP